jgi:hypothetical protein
LLRWKEEEEEEVVVVVVVVVKMAVNLVLCLKNVYNVMATCEAGVLALALT